MKASSKAHSSLPSRQTRKVLGDTIVIDSPHQPDEQVWSLFSQERKMKNMW